jgi:phosphatidylglycerophosphatase A
MDFGDPGWQHIALLLFLAYWALCRSLRYRRANLIANKFRGRDPYSLTIDEAQWIVDQITTKEMSKISRFSTAFALFRTYGIVTIAPLLMK